jgi:hypothetical protein
VSKLSSGASGATPPPRAHGGEHAASHALAVARVAGQDDGFDDGAVLQLGDVMGFVDHVRGTVLGAAHFRLGVVRVLPLGVAGFAAFALFVEAAHGFGVLGVDACLGGKPHFRRKIIPTTTPSAPSGCKTANCSPKTSTRCSSWPPAPKCSKSAT